MKRIIRLTEQDLTGLLKGIVDLALGGTVNSNKKDVTSKDEKEPTSKDEKETTTNNGKKSDTPNYNGDTGKVFLKGNFDSTQKANIELMIKYMNKSGITNHFSTIRDQFLLFQCCFLMAIKY